MKSICQNQTNPDVFPAKLPFLFGLKLLLLVVLAVGFSACATKLESKVSGKLENISKERTLAILPIETQDKNQKAMADMFRQALYAKLRESKFIILERYMVDGLLKQQGLTDPSIFREMNPMRFGEILGVDAVLISQINQVERSYFILHSSIEIGVSAKILDTRSGELLWWAKQTEQDYQGLGKIPTGMVAAVIAPISFVTNKFNLNRLTTQMVEKLTAIVKRPETAGRKETIKGSIIASATTKDIKQIQENQERNALREKIASQSRAKPVHVNLSPGHLIKEEKSIPPTKRLIYQIRPWVPQKAVISKEIPEEAPKKVAPKEKQPSVNLPEAKLQPFSPLIPETINETPEPEKTPTLQTAAAKTEAASGLFYTIQVGAYETKALAEKLFTLLVEKGYNAFIALFIQPDKPQIYRVQIDKFEEKTKAERLAQIIEDKENLQTFVTTVKPG